MEADAQRRQVRRAAPGLAPRRAVGVGDRPGARRRLVADDVGPVGGRPGHGVRPAQAVPERRMGLLRRAQHHRHVCGPVIFALEAEIAARRGVGQPLQDEIETFPVHCRGLGRIEIEERDLDRRDAAPDAEIEPPAAHPVEHADLLDQAQRRVKRQAIDRRPEAQAPCALGDRGEEHARRRRHAERRAVMLGQVIAVEAGAVVQLEQPQPVLVEVRQRAGAPVQMVENADAHDGVPVLWNAARPCHPAPRLSSAGAAGNPADIVQGRVSKGLIRNG